MSEDEELGPDARALFEAASGGDDPDALRVARVRGRLGRKLGIAAATAAAVGTVKGASAASAVGLAGWLKGALVVALIAGAGGAYVATRHDPPAPAPVVVTAPPAAPSASAPTIVQSAPVVVASVSAAPSASAPVVVKSAPPASAPAAAKDDVAAEVALLHEAQVALAEGRYVRAIDLFERHAAEYPFGALAQERRAGYTLALCGSKRSDAKDVAQKFLASHPSPPIAARVRSACAIDE